MIIDQELTETAPEDASFSLIKWQQFATRNDVMAAIFKKRTCDIRLKIRPHQCT